MFTLSQIHNALSKVKSGADFPAYIREIKQLGVLHYNTYVHDGHTDYFGAHQHTVSSPPRYAHLQVADAGNASQFNTDLQAHQQGKTDYPGFCNDAAQSGVEKWTVDLVAMTCTYYDKTGNVLLTESIPQ